MKILRIDSGPLDWNPTPQTHTMNKPNTQVASCEIELTVIGTKVHCDGRLFAKTTSWPNAMLIKKALDHYLPIHLAERHPQTTEGKPL